MNKKQNVIVDIVFVLIVIVIICIGKSNISDNATTNISDSSFFQLDVGEEISAMCVCDDEVFVGKNTGINIYDKDSLLLKRSINDISLVYSASIIKDDNNNIWIGHENGLTLVDCNGNRMDFTAPELPEGRVNTVAQVGDNIWCGTYNGAAVLEAKEGQWSVVRTLDKNSGLLSDSVNVIQPSGSSVLIGSYLDNAGGITVIDTEGDMSYITSQDGLPHPYVTSMALLENGDILAGTGYMYEGGLAYIKKEQGSYFLYKVYDESDFIPGGKVRFCYADDSAIWVTTEYDGVLIYFGNIEEGIVEENCLILTEKNGLTDNEIKCIVKTDDYYWLGGKYGLTVIPINELGVDVYEKE